MAPSEHGIDSPWLYGYTVDWNDPGDKRCCSRCYVKTAFCPPAARPKALHEHRLSGARLRSSSLLGRGPKSPLHAREGDRVDRPQISMI